MLYIANISEDDVDGRRLHNQYVQLVEDYAVKEDAEVAGFMRKSKKR